MIRSLSLSDSHGNKFARGRVILGQWRHEITRDYSSVDFPFDNLAELELLCLVTMKIRVRISKIMVKVASAN